MLQQPFLQQLQTGFSLQLVPRELTALIMQSTVSGRGLQQVPTTGCSELQHIATKTYELQQQPEMELQQSCNSYSCTDRLWDFHPLAYAFPLGCTFADALCLDSRIPAPSGSGNPSSSLPSSLPPLNVSPPSFGAAFPSSSTSPVTTRFSTATNESSLSNSGLRPPASIVSEKSGAKAGPLRVLRPQKSTSFEVSRPFNFTHNATASNMAILNASDGKPKAKPVITVSAPPANVADDHAHEFNAPRAAPAPPAASSRPRSAKEQARKTLNHFGFGHHAKKDDVAKKERRPSATVAEGRISTGSDAKSTSTEPSSPTPSLSPMLPARMEFPIPPSKGKQVATPSRTLPKLAGAFEYSPSATPTAKTPRAAVASDTSDGELSHASTRSAPARPVRPASLIIPNSGASRPRSNSAMTVTKIPSSPSSPSTGKAGAPSPRLRAIRASRSPSPASPPPLAPLPSPPAAATSDGEGWSTDASTRLGGWSTDTSARLGSLASRKSAPPRVRAHTIVGSLSKAAGALRDEGAPTLTVARQESAGPTPREDRPLRAAHDTYVRILEEKHAAEKAELLRRIERLEREARKRDRELRGLRLIILNSSTPGAEHAASFDAHLALGRLRSDSDSKASSGEHARTRSHGSSAGAHSPEDGTEDGLLELQHEVAGFIAPCGTPRMEPAQGERSGSPSSIASLRRCNTMPEGFAPPPPQRLAKRASSPVLPGLGFDLAAEPDVPALTASTTASSTPSSTLSAIPELAADADAPQHDVDERRTSRALKRLSASSVVAAASAYATNLKLGMSPSIGQVLDRTRADQEAGMDDVMRKLRAFGREQ